MSQNPEPSSPAAAPPGPDAPSTVDEVQRAADDPARDKQRTGADQAAENRELDPPA